LTQDEVEILVLNHNICDDWAQIKVHPDFSPDRIHDTRFEGKVVLGKFPPADRDSFRGMPLGPGIYRCVISDSEIGHRASLVNVGWIHQTIVDEGASILACGTISCGGETSFGNGIEIPVAIETGGREVLVFAETTVGMAETVARRRTNRGFQEGYLKRAAEYVSRTKGGMSIIGKWSRVMNTSCLENVCVGPDAVISGAQAIRNSTILSSSEEPSRVADGALVESSVIQWGSEVSSMAIVSRSLLCEHSHVERHGKVTDSIIGPNTGIGEGEVTASLVGPFVGFHHQALLIAAFWPEGKGNVAYGANVGSNHTGKAPDQEIWCGEGTFFGLGCNVKFPADYSHAPYSIIATGVTTLPQKVEFPFSLINSPAELIPGISPAYNEIRPGWVISENAYAIRRNETKFKKRNKARREEIVFEVLRPEVVDWMMEARRRLLGVEPDTRNVYTEKEISGLGKNFLTEPARKEGIEIYTFNIGLYALRGLFNQVRRLLSEGRSGGAEEVFEQATDDPRWEHERAILSDEFEFRDVPELLRELVKREKEVAGLAQISKARDDRRGVKIIEDYAHAHSPASEDPVLKAINAEVGLLEKSIEELIRGHYGTGIPRK
jgi:hypothetical protein